MNGLLEGSQSDAGSPSGITSNLSPTKCDSRPLGGESGTSRPQGAVPLQIVPHAGEISISSSTAEARLHYDSGQACMSHCEIFQEHC
jgi:hypothetical protein